MNKGQAFLSRITTSRKFLVVLSMIGLYLVSAGASWALFSYLKEAPSVNYNGSDLSGTRSKIDLSLPKTAVCPINGQMFTEPERGIWETRRPIAAVIENHADSRPLEGLHKADIVYEAVAEGGITRHLAIFYCGVSAEDTRVAPIRSARVYLVSWAAEYGANPIFTHVGGANNLCPDCPGGVKYKGQVAPQVRAIEMLVDLGWRVPKGNDFDTTYDVGFPVLFRDPERLGHAIASEHTMVSTTDAIFNEAAKRGFTDKDEEGELWNKNFVSWKFVDDKPLASPRAKTVSFEFWTNNSGYDVKWEYDSASNSYLRFNGGTEAKDLSTGEQFKAKNVVVQFIDETGPVDSEKHMFYKTVGTGEALVFSNGDIVEAKWEKESLTSRTIYSDSNGNEIELVKGQTWIEGIPTGNKVNY